MTNREKIDRIYESAKKIDQVYDVWATKYKLTLYEMMMFYEIFQKENRELTQKELSMKLGCTSSSQCHGCLAEASRPHDSHGKSADGTADQ